MHPPASPRENYMTVKIGINGFGRIGRLAFRRIFELQEKGGEAADIEVTAINDLTSPAALAYLLKYDSTHGVFKHVDGTPVDVKSTDTAIVVDGKEYPVYAERDARDLKWVANDGVEFVLECTGFYTSAEKSQAHLDAGAKKVLISAPAKDETTPTVVFGVNHDILKKDDNIVSAGSCTTNSMAAMVKLLNDKWGIKAGFMTTIHAYTGTQMILDGPRGNKSGRALRAAAINTIPHSTGAATHSACRFRTAPSPSSSPCSRRMPPLTRSTPHSRMPSPIAPTTATTTMRSSPATSSATPTVASSIRRRPMSTPLTA